MSGYELSIGGPKDGDSDVYQNMVDLNITDGASSMGSWTATLPIRGSFSDDLLSKIWVYYDDEIIFRGELESFNVDYDSATTTIEGRGLLVELNRKTKNVTYDDTTVYDAIVEFWDDTDWDALVFPPNRAEKYELHVTEYNHSGMWSWKGDEDESVQQDNVNAVPNKLAITEPNILVDETAHTDASTGSELDCMFSMYHEDETDRWSVLIETDEPVSKFDFGMHQQERWSDDGIYEEVWDSVDHKTPQRFHIFHLHFDTEWDMFRPKLQLYDETFDIVRSEVMIPDEDGFYTLENVEIDGTEFEIIQELHDLGSYEFTVNDYENMDIHSFPTGTLNGEPEWRITSSNRSKDLTNYANKVTVHGRTADDGTTPTATDENADEIQYMDSRGVGDNGVIERFEKNPDISTQQGAESRAERFLSEAVNERDESGSLEIAPQMIAPGYSYNVSAWGDAFPYGSQIGSNSLYFRGPDSPGETHDHIQYGWFNEYHSVGPRYTWEFLIHPQDLCRLDNDEYYTIFEFDETDAGIAHVLLYGDGSVGLDHTMSAGDNLTRTDPGVIRGGDTQRLSIQWSENLSDADDDRERYVYVDGYLKDVQSETPPDLDLTYADYYIGADRNGENGFKGGIDDFRLFAADEWKSEDWIRNRAYDDLVETDEDLRGLITYLRFDDHNDKDSVRNDGAVLNFSSEINGPQYQEYFGKLDEVQYSLGNGETLSLNFDISGRIDTELVSTQRSARTNRRSL